MGGEPGEAGVSAAVGADHAAGGAGVDARQPVQDAAADAQEHARCHVRRPEALVSLCVWCVARGESARRNATFVSLPGAKGNAAGSITWSSGFSARAYAIGIWRSALGLSRNGHFESWRR